MALPTVSSVSLVGLLTALLALAAAPARAAVLSTDRECYREGEPVRLGGGPFTPGGLVDVSRDGARLPGPLTADAAGTVAGQLAAPAPGQAEERPFRIAASERANPALTGSVVRLVSQFGVTVRPARGNPGVRRRVTARGFTGGGTLYAHAVRGRRRRTVRIGRLAGACGTLTARTRILRRGAGRGTYRVQFDTRRGYSRKTVPRVTFKVPVSRSFRAPGAARG